MFDIKYDINANEYVMSAKITKAMRLHLTDSSLL